MTSTFTKTLRDLDARIEELEQVRDLLGGLLTGLREMRPTDITVPGVDACECVRMVAEG